LSKGLSRGVVAWSVAGVALSLEVDVVEVVASLFWLSG
jgi:hypothetical protein